jgi:hypothetical protein
MTQTAKQLRSVELKRKQLQLQVTCRSKAEIYYMTARVAFKKRKRVTERVMWIISVFDDPNDIRNYDTKTMHRLGEELYGKGAKSDKHIIIREIVDKKRIGFSNLSVDEHKKQNQEEV